MFRGAALARVGGRRARAERLDVGLLRGEAVVQRDLVDLPAEIAAGRDLGALALAGRGRADLERRQLDFELAD